MAGEASRAEWGFEEDGRTEQVGRAHLGAALTPDPSPDSCVAGEGSAGWKRSGLGGRLMWVWLHSCFLVGAVWMGGWWRLSPQGREFRSRLLRRGRGESGVEAFGDARGAVVVGSAAQPLPCGRGLDGGCWRLSATPASRGGRGADVRGCVWRWWWFRPRSRFLVGAAWMGGCWRPISPDSCVAGEGRAGWRRSGMRVAVVVVRLRSRFLAGAAWMDGLLPALTPG
jgi:hypothetical protein